MANASSSCATPIWSIVRPTDERRAPLTTLRGRWPRSWASHPAHRPISTIRVTPLDLDRPLAVDPDAARRLRRLVRVGQRGVAPTGLAQRLTSIPSEIQLWPEHFDLATTIDRVNFGASPGDADHDEPYLYVGPFEPPSGSFWNESFGASMGSAEVPDVAAAVGFFDDRAGAQSLTPASTAGCERGAAGARRSAISAPTTRMPPAISQDPRPCSIGRPVR